MSSRNKGEGGHCIAKENSSSALLATSNKIKAYFSAQICCMCVWLRLAAFGCVCVCASAQLFICTAAVGICAAFCYVFVVFSACCCCCCSFSLSAIFFVFFGGGFGGFFSTSFIMPSEKCNIFSCAATWPTKIFTIWQPPTCDPPLPLPLPLPQLRRPCPQSQKPRQQLLLNAECADCKKAETIKGSAIEANRTAATASGQQGGGARRGV